MKKIGLAFLLSLFVIALYAQDDIESKLKKYKDLYDKGLISQPEYESLRKNTLGLNDKNNSQPEGNTKQDPEEVKQFLLKKIADESKGVIKLLNFTKTDGVSQTALGQALYEMTFVFEIQALEGFWKAPYFGIGWMDFTTLSPQQATEMRNSARLPGIGLLTEEDVAKTHNVYPKNAIISLTGFSRASKTETGWKINFFSVKGENGVRTGVPEQKKDETTRKPEVPIDKAEETSVGVKLEKSIYKY
jgi:hypothetical protein